MPSYAAVEGKGGAKASEAVAGLPAAASETRVYVIEGVFREAVGVALAVGMGVLAPRGM